MMENQKRKRIKHEKPELSLTAKGLVFITSTLTRYQVLDANEFHRVFCTLGQRQVRSTDTLDFPMLGSLPCQWMRMAFLIWERRMKKGMG